VGRPDAGEGADYHAQRALVPGPRGGSDSQLFDSIGDVKEYIVPQSSSWWTTLASTPHTKQNFAHVRGVDTRPILSTKFPETVDHAALHQALIEAKVEGRITRWGTILSPLLTDAAERIFKKLGGDLPRDQAARQAKLRAEKKAKEAASRAAAGAAVAAEKKAAEAKRQAEIDRLPAKIVVTTYSHQYLPLRYADVIEAELKKSKFESKLLYTDVQSMTFAVSADCALQYDKQTIRPQADMKMFLYVAIDNSLFFRSKFGDADPDGARVVVDEEQVRRDAAVLAEGSFFFFQKEEDNGWRSRWCYGFLPVPSVVFPFRKNIQTKKRHRRRLQCTFGFCCHVPGSP
jgi:hypothetical protein